MDNIINFDQNRKSNEEENQCPHCQLREQVVSAFMHNIEHLNPANKKLYKAQLEEEIEGLFEYVYEVSKVFTLKDIAGDIIGEIQDIENELFDE